MPKMQAIQKYHWRNRFCRVRKQLFFFLLSLENRRSQKINLFIYGYVLCCVVLWWACDCYAFILILTVKSIHFGVNMKLFFFFFEIPFPQFHTVAVAVCLAIDWSMCTHQYSIWCGHKTFDHHGQINKIYANSFLLPLFLFSHLPWMHMHMHMCYVAIRIFSIYFPSFGGGAFVVAVAVVFFPIFGSSLFLFLVFNFLAILYSVCLFVSAFQLFVLLPMSFGQLCQKCGTHTQV